MSTAGSDGKVASGLVPASAVRRELDLCVHERLKKLLPVLAVIYLAISSRYLVRPSAVVSITDWSTYAIGVVILLVWASLRRDRISADRVQPGACALAILILFRSLAEFANTADTSQTVVIAFLLIGSAGTFLAWREFAFLSIVSAAGWGILAAYRLPSTSLTGWSLVIVGAIVISTAGVRLRISRYAKVHENRLLERNRILEDKMKRDRLTLAVAGTEDGLWYWDLKSEVFYHSPSFAVMLGFQPGELKEKVDEWLDRVHPGYVAELRDELSAVVHGRTAQLQNTHRLRRRDGAYIWVLTRARPVHDDSQTIIGLAGTHADVTSLIQAEQRLLKDSFQDKLTSLPNRDFLMSCLETKIEEQRRDPSRAAKFAVIFLDLDRFKVVNDSLGHEVGDELLAAVSGRLRNCARPTDVVARFGGDEFVILLTTIRDEEEALSIGDRMQNALSAPFHIGGREVTSGASLGIILSSPEIDNTADLLRFADIAMYQAKVNGKGQVRIFNDGMRSYATKLCDLQSDLRCALARKQLLLHYQPTFSITSGQIIGVEALIRWQRSKEELVMPNDFIPLAEELGLIPEIGEWALRSACAQNSAWQKRGIPPVKMAVNLSVRQLQEKEFPDRVVCILKETNLERKWLELELTETALMTSLEKAPGTLERLSKLGVQIAVDDFGTGYSSLNYLRQFQFHSLKMDRCFVSDVATDRKTAAVARGMIALAHSLDLAVIAEGIENTAQLRFLETHQCDQGQGYLVSRAVSAEQLTELLQLGDIHSVMNQHPRPMLDLERLERSVTSHEAISSPALT